MNPEPAPIVQGPEGPFDVAAMIPARGGSKGVPRKALAELAGEPLIVHTIRAARAARTVRTVVVSTDDAEIAAVARAAGALVPALRPDDLAADVSSLEGAIRWTLATAREQLGVRIDILVNLMPTYPFRDPGLIDAAVAKLIRSRGDTVSTWTRLRSRPEEWLERTADALYPVVTGPIRDAIHDGRARAYRASGSVNVEWRNPRCQRASWIRGGWLGVPIDGHRSIDIDEPADLAAARAVADGTVISRLAGLAESGRRPRVPVSVAIPDPALLWDDSPRGDWLAWGRRVAMLLGDPNPRILEPRRLAGIALGGARGLLGCARTLSRDPEWRAGARVRVVLDTRSCLLDLATLSDAVDGLARGHHRVQLGLARVEDHPLLSLVDAGGEGTLLLDRAGVPSFRRQDLKPAFHAASFVAWRPTAPLPDLAAGEPVELDALAGCRDGAALVSTSPTRELLAARVVHDALERLAPAYVPITVDESLDVARCVQAA